MRKQAAITLLALTCATGLYAQEIWTSNHGVQITLPDGYSVNEDNVLELSQGTGSTMVFLSGPTALSALRARGYDDDALTRGWRALDPASDFPTPLICGVDQIPTLGTHPLCGPEFYLRLRVHPYSDISAVASLRQHLNLTPESGNAAIAARDFETALATPCTAQGYDLYENLAARTETTATCTSTRGEVADENDIPGATKVWLMQDHAVVAIGLNTALLLEGMLAVLPDDAAIPGADIAPDDPIELALMAEMIARAEDHADLLDLINQITVAEN